MRSTYSSLTKEQLTSLLKELFDLSKSDAPAKVKKSILLDQLFDLEGEYYFDWLGQYYSIDLFIRNEIIYRIRTDSW